MKKRIEKHELQRLVDLGYSQLTIAGLVNCSQTAVGKWLKFYNIEQKRKKNILVDLTGQKIYDWEVIERGENSPKFNHTRWICKCKCGKKRLVFASDLKSGKHKSCGKCNEHKFIQDSWFGEIQKQAKRRNLEFNITKDYLYELWIKQNGKCAISGIELHIPKKARQQRGQKCTASIDRIDNSIGYTEGNVQWVLKEINRMRNSYSLEKFIKICILIANHQKGGVS